MCDSYKHYIFAKYGKCFQISKHGVNTIMSEIILDIIDNNWCESISIKISDKSGKDKLKADLGMSLLVSVSVSKGVKSFSEACYIF